MRIKNDGNCFRALRLYQMRQNLEITQSKLAEELGVTTKTIYRWETAQVRPPKMALLATRQLSQLYRYRSRGRYLIKRSSNIFSAFNPDA